MFCSERSSNLMLGHSFGLYAVVSLDQYYYVVGHNLLFCAFITLDPRPTHLAYHTHVRAISDKHVSISWGEEWCQQFNINKKWFTMCLKCIYCSQPQEDTSISKVKHSVTFFFSALKCYLLQNICKCKSKKSPPLGNSFSD